MHPRHRAIAAWRRRVRWASFLAVAATACLIAADQAGLLLVRTHDDLTAYHGVKAKIVRIIDACTLDVDLPDELHDRPITRIRLWGIRLPGRPARLPDGSSIESTAAQAVQSMTDSQQVTLWLETQRTRDPAGRVLAHVELPDGTRLNERLLRSGLAEVDERWPHSMLTRYAQLEYAARRRQEGLWARP